MKMIDLTDLMYETFEITKETLDTQTKAIKFINQTGDHEAEFTINYKQLDILKINLKRLQYSLK